MSRLRLVLSACLVVFAFVLAAPPSPAATAPPPFITMWGSLGSGNGQFNDPAGVATDGSGFVYVADTGNNRVQKFTAAGAYVAQWGTLGSGNGQFSGPFGIMVAGGSVYVVDTGNQRVQIFTTAGAYVSQFGGAGSGSGTFSQPLCIAADPIGNVYVTDYNLNLVQKFTSTGSFLTQWGGLGVLPGQFNGASGVCVDGWGTVYVTDSANNRIQFFNGAGTSLGYFGGPGTGNGQWSNPLGIACDGVDLTVLDTGNHRVQVMTSIGYYKYQWNTGGGAFVHPHSAAIDGNFVYVADTEANRIQKFGYTPPEECHNCSTQPDPCCEALPTVGGPWTNILVTTHQRHFFLPNPYAVVIYDLTSSPVPAEDNDWASMNRYFGPANSWTADSLGSVFGLTLDEYGNIFVTQTSCYQGDEIGQVFNAGPGAVYRIDGVTGKITVFCKLPNFPDGSVNAPENYPELGNITYDCNHKQFFVTNIEDGKIYRIKSVGVNGPTGTVVETFDPLAPDNNQPGFAPIGQRLWGVQWHSDRVYYAVWAVDVSEGTGPNEIRSVALLPSGAFNPGSDQHELNVPPLQGNAFSYPVADISFSAAGKMLLGERGITNKTAPTAHGARVLEYACVAGCWVQSNHYQIGDLLPRENAEGGVDYDRHAFGGPTSAIGRVWASGDALHFNPPYTDIIYGFQGLRPNLLYGSIVNSMLIDADGNVNDQDKTYMGDVEAPGCPPSTSGTLCGHKFSDLNRNGIADGPETGLSGWTIVLNGPGGPYTATTDVNGAYCFTNLGPGAYTISEIGQSPWVQTAPAGGTYSVPLSAGQTLTGYDFGNYTCAGVPGGCVAPPPMMVAWWPFNESTISTTASDVTHLTPARNVAQLVGGAAITTGGKVQRALCVNGEGQYARVPIANQIATNWGASPFAIDGWVKPLASGAPNRMIVEKRTLVSVLPYRTLGWALYLNGQQLFLELGIGVSTQTVPGPTIPAGVWTHVAVSVDRAPAAGRWYVNGAVASSFNFVPAPGSVSNSGDIYMGQLSPPFGVGSGFNGCIDELEVISTPTPATSVLPAATVAAIYNAGVAGKCPEYLLMPSVTTICKNDTTVKVCFNICNTSGATQSYHWSASALAAGPGCTVAGPLSFSPAAGAVTVAPGSCSATICVTMPRPAGLITQNATSCFAISFVNDSTGACQTRTATIRADFTCHCITPAQSGIVSVPGRLQPGVAGVPVVIGIKFPCDPPPIALAYRVSARWMNTEHEDPVELRLNGLPPGEPVIGTLQVQPGNPDQDVTVMVRFDDGYDPSAPYEIVLEADTDGDGVPERQAGTIVQSTYDENETVAAPASPVWRESVKLALAPNPFLGGSSIAFTLGAAQDVELGVYDLVGRRVRQIHRGRLAAGPHSFDWNGRDDAGRRIAAGIYFVRYQTPEHRMEAKLVKLQ